MHFHRMVPVVEIQLLSQLKKAIEDFQLRFANLFLGLYVQRQTIDSFLHRIPMMA